MKKRICLPILLLLGCLQVFSQQTAPARSGKGLQAIARYHQNKVELRWAPADYSTWLRGNQQGYIVERYGQDGLTLLTPQPLRPLSLEQWKTQTDTSNVWNLAAAQLLYGKMKGLPDKPTMAQVKEISQVQDYQFANALIAADLSAETARGMALSFTDPDVEPGKNYGYRIRIAQARPGARDTTRVLLDTKAAWTAPELKGLQAENGEHAVTLKWDKTLSEGYFTAFWVEKSLDGGKNFSRINTEPLFVSGSAEDGAVNFHIDSLQENYRPAQYRVIGITPWGDPGLPSASVKGMGRDLTPPGGAENVKATSKAANKIVITWDAVVDPFDLAGWYIRRGNDAAGIFSNVNETPLTPAAREFIDTEPFAFQNNYYRVVAVDSAGNEGVSMNAYCYIVDSIPPAKPLGLVGSIDSNGMVALAWDLGAEPDLRGYRVYASHGPNREFKQLTSEPLMQNYFADTITLRTLSEKMYFRVAAVDYRWNHSVYSEIVELKKPDIIPPVAPVFKHYSVKGDSAVLQWANSSSADVIAQILWKKEGNAAWEQVMEFKKPFPERFVDRRLSAETATTYALEAFDDDRLSSGKSAEITVTGRPQRPPVRITSAQLDQNGPAARLQWQYPYQDCRFVVLRAKAGEPLTPLRSLSGSTTEFSDRPAEAGPYRYAVKALFADGSESQPGEPIQLQF